MTYFEALLYGLVQGVTEYLPISSSAHLILLPKFLGTEDPGLTFEVFLHLGTLSATLAYFWRDWVSVMHPAHWSRQRGVSFRAIAIATVPALIAGAVLHDLVETVFRGSEVLMCTLVIGGVILWASDRFMRRRRELTELTIKDALLIGIAQCFALVPGMSRSGSTITGARLLGFSRDSAARFSFLISAPITGAALVFELRKWRELLDGPVAWDSLLIAGVSSFVFGWLTIDILLKLLKRFGYLSFAIYRVALALTIYFVLVKT